MEKIINNLKLFLQIQIPSQSSGQDRCQPGALKFTAGLTSLVPTSLWILARFSGLAKHKSRYLTKSYSITTNCNPLKYGGI